MSTADSLLMELLPRWNRFIGRAFKDCLTDGMSPLLHFLLVQMSEHATMSDLARTLRMSRQQMTKLADKAIEMGLAVRESDPNDRRVVRLIATEKAIEYMEASRKKAREYYRNLYQAMGPEDEEKFVQALEAMNEVFAHLEMKEVEQ